MTKEYLLAQSVKEFEDKKENALLWSIDRIYTKTGYCYIVKKQSTPISCAFHFANSFTQDETLGKYQTADIVLNTRTKLGFDGIITYKDLVVAFTNSGNYNETMGQWHYFGVGAFNQITNRFLILDEKEIDANLGVNSTEIFLNLEKDYPIVPHYFEAKSDEKYILFEAREMGGAYRTGSTLGFGADNYLNYHKVDSISLTFVNFNRDEAMSEMYRIQQESLKPDTQFGINTPFDIRNIELYQIAFNWRALAYSCDFVINYYISKSVTDKLPIIKEAIFKSLAKL